MNVICISGKARAGKDFLAQNISKELKKRGRKVIVTHYADFLKYICTKYYGWNGEKDEKGRTLLQTVGQSFRDNNQDCWVGIMNNFLSGIASEIDDAIIADCRYLNELRNLDFKGLHNQFTIRIQRSNFDNGLSEEQKNHKSETELDDCLFSLYVYNNGSEEDLIKKIPDVVNEYEIFCNNRKRTI